MFVAYHYNLAHPIVTMEIVGIMQRHKWATRSMEESIPLMEKASKEEGAAWARVSRDCGFTGISQLVTLNKLFGFDVLHDIHIDLMHNLLWENEVRFAWWRILHLMH